MNRTKSTGRIAPVSTMSAADQSAHDAASYVRRPARSNLTVCPDCKQPVSGAHQCPPRADWLSPAGAEALRRADAATRKIRDDEFTRALNERGLAEYEQYAAEAAA